MLKEYLLKEPILKYPKPDQPYVLYTDASKYAWAGVLTQAYVYKEEEGNFPFITLSPMLVVFSRAPS